MQNQYATILCWQDRTTIPLVKYKQVKQTLRSHAYISTYTTLSTRQFDYTIHKLITSLVLSLNRKSNSQLDGTWKFNPKVCQNVAIRSNIVPECGNPIQSYAGTWQPVPLSLPKRGNSISIHTPRSKSQVYHQVHLHHDFMATLFIYLSYNKCDQYCNIHMHTRITMKQEHVYITQS